MDESKVFVCFSASFSNDVNEPVGECFVRGYRSITAMSLDSKERFQIFFILNSRQNVLESETCGVEFDSAAVFCKAGRSHRWHRVSSVVSMP